MTFDSLAPPYATIVADPPWPYRQNNGRLPTTSKRSTTKPDLQYSRMTLDDIRAMPVAAIADTAAHLYLWTTNPMLREAFSVVDAWGFTYRTTLTWLKEGTLGMGFFFRGETEHILFATRGDLHIPADQRQRNWFSAARQGHSVKPPMFGDLVERCSPGPYVELFARQPRLGWDSWGHGYETAAS